MNRNESVADSPSLDKDTHLSTRKEQQSAATVFRKRINNIKNGKPRKEDDIFIL